MAANQDFVRLMEDLIVHAPGAPDSEIKAAIFYALRGFLMDTNVWEAEFDIELVENQRTYVIVTGAGQRVNRLIRLFNSEDATQRGLNAAMSTPGTIELSWTPNYQPTTLVALVSLYIVDLNSDEDGSSYPVVPGWILNKYWEALLEGATGRLWMQPAKPWSNQQLGLAKMRRFSSLKAQARAEILRQNTYATQAWNYPIGMIRRQKGV